MTDQVEVWLDADFLERTRVGTLTHDRGTLRFIYEPEWLKNSQAFALDPDLSLGEGTYFPIAEAGNLRVIDDSAPDRWGQTLMKRREALAAKDENRKPRHRLPSIWKRGSARRSPAASARRRVRRASPTGLPESQSGHFRFRCHSCGCLTLSCAPIVTANSSRTTQSDSPLSTMNLR